MMQAISRRHVGYFNARYRPFFPILTGHSSARTQSGCFPVSAHHVSSKRLSLWGKMHLSTVLLTIGFAAASEVQRMVICDSKTCKGCTLLLHIFKFMQVVGVVLTLAGSAVLALGFTGFIDLDTFAFGISAGVRVVGTVAIAGCLLGAIGCFGLEYNNTQP